MKLNVDLTHNEIAMIRYALKEIGSRRAEQALDRSDESLREEARQHFDLSGRIFNASELNDIIADRPPTGKPVAGHTSWRLSYFGPCGSEKTMTYRIKSGPEHNFAVVRVEKETRGESPGTLATFRQIVEDHNNSPRLLRENEALREALNDLEAIASLVSGLMTLHGQVSPEKWYSLAINTEHARAALAQVEGDVKP